MIRTLVIFVLFLLAYSALKTVVRSALRAYHHADETAGIQGEEMVLDPQCRTYFVKGRAVFRRIKGNDFYFCSEQCAREFEEKARR